MFCTESHPCTQSICVEKSHVICARTVTVCCLHEHCICCLRKESICCLRKDSVLSLYLKSVCRFWVDSIYSSACCLHRNSISCLQLFCKKEDNHFLFFMKPVFFFFFRRGVVGHKGSCSTGQMIVWVDVCQVHVGNMKVLKSEEFGGCFQLWCVQGFCVPLCAVKDLFMSLKMLLNKNDSRLSCWSIMREPEGFYDFRVIG